MANKTINQIENTVTSVAGGDYLPIWDISAGKTGKITRENLVSGLQSTLTFDNYPTKNSSNPAKSGGIFSANAVIIASSTTITNAPTIASSSIIRVMFTSAITGSDTTTALSLSYNGTSYPVKVGKQGSLSNFVASNVNNAYTYLQAYTTLELAFDGSQFIIIGNPVVLSSSGYTIYADGGIGYNDSRYPKYYEPNNILHNGNGTYSATEDCYIQAIITSSNHIAINVNGVDCSVSDNYNGIYISSLNGYFKKNTIFSCEGKYKVYGLIYD